MIQLLRGHDVVDCDTFTVRRRYGYGMVMIRLLDGHSLVREGNDT